MHVDVGIILFILVMIQILLVFLDGGLKKWILENKEVNNNISKYKNQNMYPKENKNLVKNKNQIDSKY